MKYFDDEQRKQFRSLLLDWYTHTRRQLPWRRDRDPYRVWISEVMLQQTRVQTVLDYYERFLQQFPDVQRLAAAELETVLKAWEGMGYYARARNLHRAARYIVEELNGQLPQSYEELAQIPGIGPYTAAAIASISFGEARAVLDGNVQRVLARLLLIRERLGRAEVRRRLQEAADKLLDSARPGDFNQAMMELGATLCTPRRPKCLLCPVKRFCRAVAELEDPAQLPLRRPRDPVPHYDIAVGLIWDEGLLFIDRRQEDGLLGGLWEFPGGKIEAGETPQQAVKREIKEELDLDVEVGDFFMEVRHAYTHFKITMRVYHCIYTGGEPRLTAAIDWRWVRPEELKYFPFAAASQKIIRRLEAEYDHVRGRRRS